MTLIHTTFITSLLIFVSFSSVQAAESSSWMIPDSFQEINWNPIEYHDEIRKISAKLPGELQATISTEQKCLYLSSIGNTRYAIHFNPSAAFTPPDTLEEFISRFSSIPGAQVIPLVPNQPHVRYLLQVNFFDEEGSDIQIVSHIYATGNTLYFAFVEGRDLLQADDFFNTIQIMDPDPDNKSITHGAAL